MSLQVWLPLNGDLNNQGLSNFNPSTSSTANFSENGKIGKSLTVSNASYLTIPYQGDSQNNYTFSFWINIPSSMNKNTNWESMLAFKAINSASNSTINTVGISYASYHQVKIYDDSNHQHSWRTPNYDTWEHWTIIHESTDNSSKITFYINGILYGSWTTSHPIILQNGDIIFGYGITVGNFNINDVRIYNHALSQMEVREIAKGLILHYPLRDGYIENTINVVTYPTVDSTSYNPGWDSTKHIEAITVSGWTSGYNGGVSNPSEGYHAYWRIIDNIPTIVFQDLNSSIGQPHRWLGIAGGGLLTSQISSGTTYTVSFEAKATVEGKQIYTGLHYKRTSNDSNSFYDGLLGKTITTSWQRYSWTYTCPQMYSISGLYIYGHYGTEGISYVRNIQVEIKNHSTPYTNNNRCYSSNKNNLTNLISYNSLNIYNNYGVTASLATTGEYFLGAPVYRLTITPTSSNIDNFKTSLWAHGVTTGNRITFKAYTQYCYWIYYKPITHTDIRVGGTASNISGWTEISPHNYINGWYRVGQYRKGDVTSDKTDSIYTSFYSPSATADTPISIDFCSPVLLEGTTQIFENFYYNSLKCEKYIVEDCSGFGNNGLKIGDIEASTNSPRNDICYFFNSSNVSTYTDFSNPHYIHGLFKNIISNPTELTISWWSNLSQTYNGSILCTSMLSNENPSDYTTSAIRSYDNLFRFNNSSGTYARPYVATNLYNEWIHWTLTYDGSNAKVYKNGILANSEALTGTLGSFSDIYLGYDKAGGCYRKTVGYYSDFRVYTTALSAEEVMNLYKNDISIDENENTYGYEFKEI